MEDFSSYDWQDEVVCPQDFRCVSPLKTCFGDGALFIMFVALFVVGVAIGVNIGKYS